MAKKIRRMANDELTKKYNDLVMQTSISRTTKSQKKPVTYTYKVDHTGSLYFIHICNEMNSRGINKRQYGR